MIKLAHLIALIAFITNCVVPSCAFSQALNELAIMPQPGTMAQLSPRFSPAHLVGITIDTENALRFDFIIHKGDQRLSDDQKPDEYRQLVKYFLAALTIPDEDQWVNLSPYEDSRIIKDNFGMTEMGRDLLAQDYFLKQLTASLMHPDSELGKKFWERIYAEAFAKFGTTNIPIDTFNKIWITPERALIFEKGHSALILESRLKVQTERDYLSLKNNAVERESGPVPVMSEATELSAKIVKDVILPAIETEVNEGKNFAKLRQIYSAMILAAWYKEALRQSLLGKIYADKAKVKGVDQDIKNNEAIYQRYLEAFRKGAFNFIKEDYDRYTEETIPRKYFSGGFKQKKFGDYAQRTTKINPAQEQAVNREVTGDKFDDAMISLIPSQEFQPTQTSIAGIIFPTLLDSLSDQRYSVNFISNPYAAPNAPFVNAFSGLDGVNRQDVNRMVMSGEMSLFAAITPEKQTIVYYLKNRNAARSLLETMVSSVDSMDALKGSFQDKLGFRLEPIRPSNFNNNSTVLYIDKDGKVTATNYDNIPLGIWIGQGGSAEYFSLKSINGNNPSAPIFSNVVLLVERAITFPSAEAITESLEATTPEIKKLPSKDEIIAGLSGQDGVERLDFSDVRQMVNDSGLKFEEILDGHEVSELGTVIRSDGITFSSAEEYTYAGQSKESQWVGRGGEGRYYRVVRNQNARSITPEARELVGTVFFDKNATGTFKGMVQKVGKNNLANLKKLLLQEHVFLREMVPVRDNEGRNLLHFSTGDDVEFFDVERGELSKDRPENKTYYSAWVVDPDKLREAVKAGHVDNLLPVFTVNDGEALGSGDGFIRAEDMNAIKPALQEMLKRGYATQVGSRYRIDPRFNGVDKSLLEEEPRVWRVVDHILKFGYKNDVPKWAELETIDRDRSGYLKKIYFASTYDLLYEFSKIQETAYDAAMMQGPGKIPYLSLVNRVSSRFHNEQFYPGRTPLMLQREVNKIFNRAVADKTPIEWLNALLTDQAPETAILFQELSTKLDHTAKQHYDWSYFLNPVDNYAAKRRIILETLFPDFCPVTNRFTVTFVPGATPLKYQKEIGRNQGWQSTPAKEMMGWIDKVVRSEGQVIYHFIAENGDRWEIKEESVASLTPADAVMNAVMDNTQKQEFPNFTDNAQFTPAATDRKGGIDMNTTQLDMKIRRGGNGVPLPVDQQNIENIQIDGLVPEILRIQPVTSLPMLNEVAVPLPPVSQ